MTKNSVNGCKLIISLILSIKINIKAEHIKDFANVSLGKLKSRYFFEYLYVIKNPMKNEKTVVTAAPIIPYIGINIRLEIMLNTVMYIPAFVFNQVFPLLINIVDIKPLKRKNIDVNDNIFNAM